MNTRIGEPPDDRFMAGVELQLAVGTVIHPASLQQIGPVLGKSFLTDVPRLLIRFPVLSHTVSAWRLHMAAVTLTQRTYMLSTAQKAHS